MYAVKVCYLVDEGYLIDELFDTFEKAQRRAEDSARNWPEQTYQVLKLEPVATLVTTVHEPKYDFNWK